MEIVQKSPAKSVINSLIESYFFISKMEVSRVSTIPNGRVDATIVLDGEIEWLYRKKNEYRPLSPFCFYPITNQVNVATLKSTLKCVSIKFFPHLLALPPFKGKSFDEPRPFSDFFSSEKLNSKLLQELKNTESIEDQVALLDTYFISILFPDENSTHWLRQVTAIAEKSNWEKINIRDIAQLIGVSIKTLERKFINSTGLTPKAYLKIIQLQRTIRDFKNKREPFAHGDMVKLMGAGYYDQAHFVKSCRRITGLTPKQLFVNLPKGMTDVVLH